MKYTIITWKIENQVTFYVLDDYLKELNNPLVIPQKNKITLLFCFLLIEVKFNKNFNVTHGKSYESSKLC